MFRRPIEKGCLECYNLAVEPIDCVAHPKAKIGRDFVIARPSRVQSARHLGGNDLPKVVFDVLTDVFFCGAELKYTGLNLGENLPAAERRYRNVGLCFHVGSQCMEPNAYRVATSMMATLVDSSGVEIKYLDVGGGFPGRYPGMSPCRLFPLWTNVRFNRVHAPVSAAGE